MDTKALQTLVNEAEHATPQDIHYTALFLKGLKYAEKYPDSNTAMIIKQINNAITHGSREELINLTSRLEYLPTERN